MLPISIESGTHTKKATFLGSTQEGHKGASCVLPSVASLTGRSVCISPRDLFIMTLFQFACGCRGEKPQVLRAALLLQATRPRLLRMHKEAINYIFQFDSLCTKHLRPNVNWAHFSAAQFSPKPRTIHFPRFLCLLHAGMQVFRVYLHNSTYYLHCYTALLAPKSQ